MMDQKKKFGLVMPKKAEKIFKTKSIFESDSDEDVQRSKRPKIPQKKLDLKSKIKEESLEDPSIYEYDSIYDDMKAKQAESSAPKEKKNSRYIETLLKAADKKKREHERRIERKIQVEREKEGDKYRDKESFVTSTYKKKMQEREEEEERERRENMLNDMMDVTKQEDLSGFYRHFLNQTIGEEKIPTFDDRHRKVEVMCIKTEDSSSVCSYNAVNLKDNDNDIDKDSDGIEIDSDSDSQNSESHKCSSGDRYSAKDSALKVKDRYSDNEETCETGSVKSKNFSLKKHNKYKQIPNQTNSESESSDNENISNHTSKQGVFDEHERNFKKGKCSKNNLSDSSQDAPEVSVLPEEKPEEFKPSESEEHVNRNIYIKRTVGDVFAEAQARYFQRMCKKSTGIL